MKIVNIKLFNPPLHINPFLTHWTGRKKDEEQAFVILKKIVETCELKFSSHRNNFFQSHETVSSKMVCFTDTPIKQSLEHCNRYNYFGISFNKEAIIEYGANPVLYLVDNRRKHQEFLNHLNFNFLPAIDHKYKSKNEQKHLFSWFGSVMQPYDTKILSSANAAEFHEREWRITRILPFPWIDNDEKLHGPYNEYKYDGNIRRVEIDNNRDNDEFYLVFNKKIVENIIVPSNYQKQAEELLNRNDLSCELIVIER